MFLIQSPLHDLFRQFEMTLPLHREDNQGVAFILVNLTLVNINKTLFQEFIIKIHRNPEHKEFLETKRLKISQGKG